MHLFVNGKPFRVGGSQAFLTLSDFLRNDLDLVGTKIVCSEGDCGACSVLVGRRSSGLQRLAYHSIDSCIAFLYQLDQTHVVTVEGLGGETDLSTVQQAMIRCHGSQCGYCTPGFVTTIHGLFEEHHDRNGDRPAQDVLDEETLRIGLSGNLCRCTGYVQIIEAAQSIGPADVPRIENLYPSGPILKSFDESADEPAKLTATANGETKTVFLPHSVDQAVAFKSQNTDARIVTGATDVGVQFNHGSPIESTLLSLANVTELSTIDLCPDALIIGAGATWTQIIDSMRDYYPEFVDILLRFGSPQIRNMGTIAGNLANASPIADCIPFLSVIDATLQLVSPRGRRQVGVDDFYLGYKQIDLNEDELIESVRCPLPSPNQHVKLCKVSKRRDMDISTFTAAMRLTITDGQIVAASVALGGVGPTVIRAGKCEREMIGRPLSLDVMRRAGVVARSEIRPISDVRGSESYRGLLAENIFVKWFHELSHSIDTVSA